MSGEIRLREFGDADIALLRKWLGEEHVARWYEHPADWIYELENRGTEFSWIHHYIAEYSGLPIGFCQYYEYCRSGETWQGDADVNGAYSIDYLIGDRDYVGRSLGKELVLALIDKVAARVNAKSIIVQPAPENKASQGTLLSAGFVFDKRNGIYQFFLL